MVAPAASTKIGTRDWNTEETFLCSMALRSLVATSTEKWARTLWDFTFWTPCVCLTMSSSSLRLTRFFQGDSIFDTSCSSSLAPTERQ